MASKPDLTLEELKRVLRYEPETGVFTWRIARGRAPAGAIAGHVRSEPDGRQYQSIRVNKQAYFAHRLAWMYMTGSWPILGIDHRDCNGLNNAFANLREATLVENGRNARLSRRNKIGLKGVFWNTEKEKWTTRIRLNGRNVHIGHFDCPHQAAAAYREVALREFGEFARVE